MLKNNTKKMGLWVILLVCASLVPFVLGLLSLVSPGVVFAEVAVTTSAQTGNSDPVITSIVINDGNNYTPDYFGQTPTQDSFSIVIGYTDENGCADVPDMHAVEGKFFRSGVTSACTIDQNNCFSFGASACTKVTGSCTGAGDIDGFISCNIAEGMVQYWTDSTVGDGATYPGEYWDANVVLKDSSDATDTANASDSEFLEQIEMNAVIAHAVLDASSGLAAMAYDTLALGEYSTDPEHLKIYNYGNASLDEDVIANVDNLDCATGIIPTHHQEFAFTPFSYGAGVPLVEAAGTASELDLNLANRTDEAYVSPQLASDGFYDIYWKVLAEDVTAVLPLKGACVGATKYTVWPMSKYSGGEIGG
jgi:hypothetical protein